MAKIQVAKLLLREVTNILFELLQDGHIDDKATAAQSLRTLADAIENG